MKCLWCGDPVELYDPGMYQFCDRCLANLETLSLDLDEAERKFRAYRGDSRQHANQRRRSL
jgi:hypothetical protein